MKTLFLAFALIAVAAVSILSIGGAGAASAAGPCAATGLETVATDKADYAPNETVHITGTGYSTDCDVTIKVTRPNGSVVTGDGSFGPWPTPYDTVATAPDGTFAYHYILNGVLGEYVVEVLGLDGAVLSTTTFTDATTATDIAPAYYPGPAQVRNFSILLRNTAGTSARCAQVDLPSDFTVTSFTSSDFEVGAGNAGWAASVTNIGGQPRRIHLLNASTPATAIPSSGANNYVRFEISAMTPAVSNLSLQWIGRLASGTTLSSGACSSGVSTRNVGVKIGNEDAKTYTADFRDGSGNVTTPALTEGGAAQTFRLRISNNSGGSGDKISYALIALPFCFTNPTSVSVTSSNGGFPDYTFEARDKFIRLISGELEKDQNPDHDVQVQFDSAATASCAGGDTAFYTSAWKSAGETSSSAADTFNISGNHATAFVNTPPTVAANNATVVVNEGQAAANTGTYSDVDAPRTS